MQLTETKRWFIGSIITIIVGFGTVYFAHYLNSKKNSDLEIVQIQQKTQLNQIAELKPKVKINQSKINTGRDLNIVGGSQIIQNIENQNIEIFQPFVENPKEE